MAEIPDNWANIEAKCNKLTGNWDGSGDTGFKQPKSLKDDDGFKLVSYRETNKTPKPKDKGLFGGSIDGIVIACVVVVAKKSE